MPAQSEPKKLADAQPKGGQNFRPLPLLRLWKHRPGGFHPQNQLHLGQPRRGATVSAAVDVVASRAAPAKREAV